MSTDESETEDGPDVVAPPRMNRRWLLRGAAGAAGGLALGVASAEPAGAEPNTPVTKGDYEANSFLAADDDDLPTARTVGPSTLLGRSASGGIGGLSPAEAKAVLRSLLDGTYSISLTGLMANIPAPTAANAGWTYVASDVNGGTTFRSNGISWVQTAAAVAYGADLAIELAANHFVGAGGAIVGVRRGVVPCLRLGAANHSASGLVTQALVPWNTWKTYAVDAVYANTTTTPGTVAFKFDHRNFAVDGGSFSTLNQGALVNHAAPTVVDKPAVVEMASGLAVPTSGQVLAFRCWRRGTDPSDTLDGTEVALLALRFRKVT